MLNQQKSDLTNFILEARTAQQLPQLGLLLRLPVLVFAGSQPVLLVMISILILGCMGNESGFGFRQTEKTQRAVAVVNVSGASQC